MKAASHLAALERVRTLLARHAGVETATPEVSGGPANGAESEPAAETGNNPLAHLCRLFHLSPFERDILLLTAGAELDATFAPLCAKAQSDPRHDHPTFGLALAALPGADWRAFLPDAPLRHWQLVRLAPGSHLMTGELRIDERILHFLLGHDSRDEGLAGRVEPVPPPETAPVPSQARLAERLAATWKRTLGTADFPVLELSGGDTADVRALAVAIADRLGWTLQSTAAEDLPTDPADLEAFVRRWHREAMLRHGALLVEAHDLRPDAPQQVALRRFVNLTRTALLVARPRRGAGGGF